MKAANTCYAKLGPLSIHWNRVNNNTKGSNLNDFLEQITKLPEETLWRHNVAGDLPGENNEIAQSELYRLVDANRGKKGFTYTHKPVLAEQLQNPSIILKNKNSVKHANKNGFTINLSADNIGDADKMVALDIAPVCVVLPSTQLEDFKTPDGNTVKICPAIVNDKYTCQNCAICQKAKRRFIVGFPAHGVRKRLLDNNFKNGTTT